MGVALSGGRDSCLAASLLGERGVQLVAYTLQLMPHQDVGTPAALAELLHIPHTTIDAQRAFGTEVIERTVRLYRRALTPNPCVLCNWKVKFPLLLERVMRDGCSTLVTGHYARVRNAGSPRLLRARDKTRDQSYFLCLLRHRVLTYLHLPLGELSPKRTRKLQRSFPLRDRCLPRSRDACFLKGRGLVPFLSERLGAPKAGRVLDAKGNTLGTHRGATFYTVGQRKGFGLSGGPWYVLTTSVRKNTVVVGTKEQAHSRRLRVGGVNWVSVAAQAEAFRAEVQIRSSHLAAPATVHPLSPSRADVEFDQPQFGIAPGQFAVFYDGDLLLGGGTIRD